MTVTPVLALLLSTLVVSAGGRGPELQFLTSEDRALPCPAHALLEEAVRLRLPGVRVAAGSKRGPDDLTARLTRAGVDGWRFEVTRADGSVALGRALQPMACPQLADTCALILERFLSAIDWKGQQVRLEAPARPPSTPAIPDAPAQGPLVAATEAEVTPAAVLDATPKPEVPAPANEEAPLEPRPPEVPAPAKQEAPPEPGPPEVRQLALTLSLGGGAWASVPLEAAPHLTVELGLRVARRFRFGLQFAGAASRAQDIVFNGALRGTLTLQPFAALATAAVCTLGDRPLLCGGLIGGVRLTAGSVAGSGLFRKGSALVPLPELGVHGHLVWPLVGRLSLGAQLAVAFPLGNAQFEVQGIEAAGAATPRVDLLGSLFVGFRID